MKKRSTFGIVARIIGVAAFLLLIHMYARLTFAVMASPILPHDAASYDFWDTFWAYKPDTMAMVLSHAIGLALALVTVVVLFILLPMVIEWIGFETPEPACDNKKCECACHGKQEFDSNAGLWLAVGTTIGISIGVSQ